VFFTRDNTAHRYQIGIRPPYRQVAIVAVAIILLPYPKKTCSMNEREIDESNESREPHVEYVERVMLEGSLPAHMLMAER
jgi:hypothetical protein